MQGFGIESDLIIDMLSEDHPTSCEQGGWKRQALRIPCSCCNSPGAGDLDEGRGGRDSGEQEREGHVLKQKRQAASTHPSTLVPLTLCHPYTCHPGEETCLPCLRKQAWTADWAAKVAITLSGFPTQLREKQSLPSAALSAPLYIKTALYVATVLKLRIAVLCQAMLCWNWVSEGCLSGKTWAPGVPTCQACWQWLLGCLSPAGFETRTW